MWWLKSCPCCGGDLAWDNDTRTIAWLHCSHVLTTVQERQLIGRDQIGDGLTAPLPLLQTTVRAAGMTGQTMRRTRSSHGILRCRAFRAVIATAP